ncbi:MAG TPA: hypothetical protein VKD91_08360 [Pyrinomonadaceae bacterium]|nr:hypothetical protein [Pyrinomonadaceae bacterium]
MKFQTAEAEAAARRLKDLIREHDRWVDASPRAALKKTCLNAKFRPTSIALRGFDAA